MTDSANRLKKGGGESRFGNVVWSIQSLVGCTESNSKSDFDGVKETSNSAKFVNRHN